MVSVIKGQSKLETLYHILLLVEDEGSGLPITTTDMAADGVETSRHRRHGKGIRTGRRFKLVKAEYH